MSVLTIIIPVDEANFHDSKEFLTKFGVELPAGTTSCYPKPSEIRKVLDDMPDYTKKYFITDRAWDVDVYETASYDEKLRLIRGKNTSICSMGTAPDESVPLAFYFHSGWEELNVEITLRLTHFTGPLILMCDCDSVPILVSPNDKLEDLIEQWQKNREIADAL